MSTPRGTGAGRLRTAGLALVAIAMIAVLVGLVVAVTREGQQTSAPSETVAPTDLPSSPSAVPSVIPYPPPVPSFPAEAPAAAPPGPIPPDAVDDLPVSDGVNSRGAVRVYNNSTIRGLAARAADDLTAAGWTVLEVGNYPQGIIPATTVYYQEGSEEQAIAEAIGAEFGIRVEPRFPGIANADPGLIVIVTNDYSG